MPNSFEIKNLDQIDHDIACRNLVKFSKIEDPREGDYVIFADDVTRRISHVYGRDWEPKYQGVQTSDGGSWYFGEGYCSFSGGLYPPVPLDSLMLTNEVKLGRVWMFHHNYHTAGNGINFDIPFRVYKCSLNANK